MSEKEMREELHRLHLELASVRRENNDYRDAILEMLPKEHYEITEEDVKALTDDSMIMDLLLEFSPRADRTLSKKKKLKRRNVKAATNS